MRRTGKRLGAQSEGPWKVMGGIYNVLSRRLTRLDLCFRKIT